MITGRLFALQKKLALLYPSVGFILRHLSDDNEVSMDLATLSFMIMSILKALRYFIIMPHR